MEIREWAWRILTSSSLDKKLSPVRESFTDSAPGVSLRILQPARPAGLRFAPRRTAPAMPALSALADPSKRAVAHHIMANHELQALEVMAWVLLMLPDAPAEFRLGLTWVMADEQKHTRMHVERARTLGLEFGDLPVNSYIWKKSMEFVGVLDYLAGLPLVFEGRNLDHTLEFAEAFSRAGDERSSALMRTIHRDEIEHVRFAVDWLRRMKPAGWTDWQTFTAHLHYPLRPEKAKGDVFQRQARLQAGMTEDFVRQLEDLDLNSKLPPPGNRCRSLLRPLERSFGLVKPCRLPCLYDESAGCGRRVGLKGRGEDYDGIDAADSWGNPGAAPPTQRIHSESAAELQHATTNQPHSDPDCRPLCRHVAGARLRPTV